MFFFRTTLIIFAQLNFSFISLEFYKFKSQIIKMEVQRLVSSYKQTKALLCNAILKLSHFKYISNAPRIKYLFYIQFGAMLFMMVKADASHPRELFVQLRA